MFDGADDDRDDATRGGLIVGILLVLCSAVLTCWFLWLILRAISSVAHADSANFYMEGVCDGLDAPQLHPAQMIEFAAAFPSGAPPVYIRGLQVRLFPQDGAMLDRNSYLFAGDNDQPDILAWGKQWFDGTWTIDWQAPPGMAWRWGKSHVDLHVGCYPKDVRWTAFYTVSYTFAAPLAQ